MFSFVCIAEIKCGLIPQVPGLADPLQNSNAIHYFGDSFEFACTDQFALMGGSSNDTHPNTVQCLNGYWDLGNLKCVGSVTDFYRLQGKTGAFLLCCMLRVRTVLL